MCCSSGRTSVTWCRNHIVIVLEQPMVIRSALFWVVCSFQICDAADAGCLAGWTYDRMHLKYYLYTRVIFFFDLPKNAFRGRSI